MESPLFIVDAHLHLWDPERLSYPWLQNFANLNRTFSIPEYRVATKEVEIKKMIFIQCECAPEQYLEEIQFVLQAAREDERIKGIVCWFPLRSANAIDLIPDQLSHPLIKGIRCLEEFPESLYRNPIFCRNVQALSSLKLSFDLCVSAIQLPNAIALVEK